MLFTTFSFLVFQSFLPLSFFRFSIKTKCLRFTDDTPLCTERPSTHFKIRANFPHIIAEIF